LSAALHAAAIADPSSERTRATVWSAVLLLAAVLFAGGMIRTVFSPLQEAAKLDLKLSDFAISLVQGIATGAPVALVSIPLAWVIDHGRRVRLLIILFVISGWAALPWAANSISPRHWPRRGS
jgi:predicted MFS family arabinose efflux permease